MVISIVSVIVTFNRKALLIECLDALLKQTRPLEKIIIIDNSSSDGTPELLKEKGYLCNPIIEYARMEENIGVLVVFTKA